MQRKLIIAVAASYMLSSALPEPAQAGSRNGFGAALLGFGAAALVAGMLNAAHARPRRYAVPVHRVRAVSTRSLREAHEGRRQVRQTREDRAPSEANGAAPVVPGAMGALSYVPTFLPSRPAYVPGPDRSSSGAQQEPGRVPVLAPAPSPFEVELINFDNRLRETSAPSIERDKIVAAISAVYASATVSRLEALPNEGWTRDILQAHILRRAQAILQEFAADLRSGVQPREIVLAQLFTRAARESLPAALTEQEAVAFSTSWLRYSQKIGGANAPADQLGLAQVQQIANTGADGNVVLAGLFQEADAIVLKVNQQGEDWLLRGKLRARRIALDCVIENAAPAPTSSALCLERVQAAFAGSDKFGPVPAESVWTQQGPMFRGKKWEIALVDWQ